MFVVRIDGAESAVMNSFDSAAVYADGIRGPGRRVTIKSLPESELAPVLRMLEHREATMMASRVKARTDLRRLCGVPG